jgi:GntR family transcriptional repressor for pyruvate dehydrogenase complex
MPKKRKEDPNPVSSTDQVLDWLQEHVRAHDMAIGDTLPKEEDIVRETGMSRTSVREALTRLRAFGVVNSRKKRGMILTRPMALLNFARLLAQTHIAAPMIGHIGGFRSAVEMGFAREIFLRATPRDAAALRAIYTRMAAQAAEPADWYRLDRDFHSRLISITGNKLAIWFWQLLDPFFEFTTPHDMDRPIPEVTIEKHRMLVEALEQRNPYVFLHSMEVHHLMKVSYDAPMYQPVPGPGGDAAAAAGVAGRKGSAA